MISSLDFTLTWDPIDGGSTNDFVQVQVRGCGDGGEEIFFTGEPGRPDALNGLSTSATIKGRKLRPGQTYGVELLVARLVTFDTTSYPGAIGLAGYSKSLQSTLVTLGTATGCAPGEFALAFNFPQGSFINGTNGNINPPQGLSYYFAHFNIQDENGYPATVIFNGPAGSGITNSASQNGGSNSGNSAFYGSPSINTPPFPPGGVYTVSYKGDLFQFNLLPPDAANQQVLIVPNMVVDSSNILRQINWSYQDVNGALIPPPAFMEGIEISIDGLAGDRLYDTPFGGGIAPAITNHVLTRTVIWTNANRVSTNFKDLAGHRYTCFWERFSNNQPGGPPVFFNYFRALPNREFEMTIHAESGHNYRFEGSTSLTNWSPLQTTLSETNGSLYFRDTNAPAMNQRFYRAVLLSP